MGVPLIGGAMLAGGAMQYFGQSQAAKAQSNYYSYLADTSRTNIEMARASGEAQSRAVSLEEADTLSRRSEKTRQIVGAQKAAMVSGVGAGSRSAQDIIKDTMTKGSLDEQAIRLNAELKRKGIATGTEMESFNLASQAGGYEIAGRNVRAALPWQQASTLLGTATQAGSFWYTANRYSK